MPAVTTRLKTMPINDVFARNVKIRADGRMVHDDMYLVQVKAPSDVKEKWDYYDVKETIPADEAFQLLSTSEAYHSVALRDLKAKATPGEALDTLGQEGTDAGQEREYARKGDNCLVAIETVGDQFRCPLRRH
jgi:hypothetical protein